MAHKGWLQRSKKLEVNLWSMMRHGNETNPPRQRLRPDIGMLANITKSTSFIQNPLAIKIPSSGPAPVRLCCLSAQQTSLRGYLLGAPQHISYGQFKIRRRTGKRERDRPRFCSGDGGAPWRLDFPVSIIQRAKNCSDEIHGIWRL